MVTLQRNSNIQNTGKNIYVMPELNVLHLDATLLISVVERSFFQRTTISLVLTPAFDFPLVSVHKTNTHRLFILMFALKLSSSMNHISQIWKRPPSSSSLQDCSRMDMTYGGWLMIPSLRSIKKCFRTPTKIEFASPRQRAAFT